MKTRLNPPRCDGVTRRDVLQVGALSAFGLGLPDLFRLRAAAAQGSGVEGQGSGVRGPDPDRPSPNRKSKIENRKSEAVILIWLDGGPSHLDTFDPKPEAPSEIRGEFRAIETSVSGLRICEHLPRTARVMDRVALVRSLTHELGNHDTGSHYLLTGHRPTPALEYPSLGSLVTRSGPASLALPPYVAIPEAVPAARAGFLSAEHAPFSVGGDLARPGYRVRDLSLPAPLRLERLERRREMVRALDEFSRRVEQGAAAARDASYEQAYRLLTGPEARAAFAVDREPTAARDRYGRHRLGTGCLLARRLVEAGVRFVTVVDSGWDHHTQIFKALPDAFVPGSGKLPALDQAYAALIGDLFERRLLERTLVVLMGEFVRTPKMNSAGGRDHWPRAGWVCLAGGGVRGGQAIGATDAHGEAPSERAVRPEDLAVTLLQLLGIDPRAQHRTPDGRPLPLVAGGEFIAGIA